MIKWAPFPFLRIIAAFISGILLYTTFGAFSYPVFNLFAASIFGFGLVFMLAKSAKSSFLFSVSGIVGLLSFMVAGYAFTFFKTAKNDPANFLNQPGEVSHYVGYIDDFLLEKPAVYQSVLQLQRVKRNGKWEVAQGKIQVSIRREPGVTKPHYGDVLAIKGAPKLVSAPLNPGQFDYRKYLERQQIYHQQYLYPGQFAVIGQHISNPAMALSIRLRSNFDRILKEFVPTKREYSIASALILGIKDELDNEIKATYSNTGTTHVLAVSGLHVGLVFAILNLFLKRLSRKTSRRIFSALVVLSVVWIFAFVTALSPSVLRAAVMFTFVTGAQLFLKRANIYNTLAATAFFLLWYNPYYLFDVGFQLSFLAVVSIVYLQPRFFKLFTFQTRWKREVWTLVCVSLVAQIGTLALSLYYFHQFPVYFLLSNMLAVPISTLGLYAGLALLALSWVPYVNVFAGKILQGLLWIMNELMILLEQLPNALITRVPFTGFDAFLLYVFLILLIVFFARPKLKYLATSVAVLLIFSVSQIKEAVAANAQQKLIIFSVSKQSVWGFLDNNVATVFADSAFIQNKQAINFNLEPVFQKAQIRDVRLKDMQEVCSEGVLKCIVNGQQIMVWRGQKLVSLTKPLKNNLETPAEIDYLILQNNVWVSPEKLAANFKFRKVIFDSSNKSWYVKKVSEQLKAANISFHDVATDGAFVVER